MDNVSSNKSGENHEPTSSQSHNTFSMITWNLDGLDTDNLQQRTLAVVDLIEKGNHSVIFFQELIPATYEYIVSRLKLKYLPIVGTNHPNDGYFTATFLRLNYVEYIDHEIINFPGTRMDRNVLVIKCNVGHTKLVLFNTHLESTAAFARERVNQLKMCFNHCMSFAPDWNIIFGGDLNIRDSEVLGNIPSNMYDLWIKCGSTPSSTYTWDLTRNTNKQMTSAKQPQCRFDRLYFRESTPSTIAPDYFGLTRFDKVIGIGHFPSDHWAVIVVFRLIVDGE